MSQVIFVAACPCCGCDCEWTERRIIDTKTGEFCRMSIECECAT